MISIVDDDESVREATKGLVRSLGYDAVTFGSAEEFLSSERLHDSACLIADVQMPGLSGIELQSHLIAEGFRLPVIFVTGYPEDRVRERALKDGAIGFFNKPFDEENLIACLDKAIELSGIGSRDP